MTIQEHFGALQGLNLAYLGDGNNIATLVDSVRRRDGRQRDLFRRRPGYQPPRDILTQASWLAAASGAKIDDQR